MTIDEIFEGVWILDVEYLIQCPYCGDHHTHDHCYINVEKQVFVCHYCGESGVLKKLLKDFGDGAKVLKKAGRERKKYNRITSEEFEKLWIVTGTKGTNDKLALRYLRERGLTRLEIEKYDIRYASNGRYFGRVIIPVYEENEMVCFIARSFLDFVEPKYLFPHHGETKLTTNEAIFGYDDAMKTTRDGLQENFVLVEGVFDAMAVNKSTCDIGLAIMSKSLSEGQLYKLLKLDGWFFIMLDPDAKKDALKVAEKLSAYGREVKIAFLQDKDPAASFREDIAEALYASKEFSHELEIQIKLED